MDNQKQVISLDPSKLWYKNKDGNIIVYKQTSITEKNNLIKAKQFLKDKFIKIGNIAYSINVPDVYYWDDNNNILSMSYCHGDNLELLLRDSKKREFAIPILQYMLKFVLTQHFYWQDFAPRNIILDSEKIYLVDFEKGLDFSIDSLQTFFRNHVYEEYSSFLLPEERLISSNKIFSPSVDEKHNIININTIKVKRIKSIALALGYSEFISIQEYLDIQAMIIKAEQPFKQNGELIFPRINLVKMLENKNIDPSVYRTYAYEILFRNNLLNRKSDEVEQD